MTERFKLTEEEWKLKLTPERYRVLRMKGTERPFTGELLNNKEEGVYVCGGCGQELFSSDDKFESGSGWPSFFDAIEKDRLSTRTDHTHGMVRTEILCSRCGGHLGHLFEDGPKPTGLRYCVNSLSLGFRKNG
ncbi:MAG: peptide-methionine (R)-S-oxide reductase MsrB [Thermoplasmatota archaeon]